MWNGFRRTLRRISTGERNIDPRTVEPVLNLEKNQHDFENQLASSHYSSFVRHSFGQRDLSATEAVFTALENNYQLLISEKQLPTLQRKITAGPKQGYSQPWTWLLLRTMYDSGQYQQPIYVYTRNNSYRRASILR